MNNNATIEKREQKTNVPERIDQGAYYTPLVDIVENKDEFIFQADLPGVKAGDVDISFENGALNIHAKVFPRQPENQDYVLCEYGVGHFYRSFDIGMPINVEGIRATLKNGELTLRLPKAESAKTRKIEIKST
jgi:HSP20 family molecular chaperone IbpA